VLKTVINKSCVFQFAKYADPLAMTGNTN